MSPFLIATTTQNQESTVDKHLCIKVLTDFRDCHFIKMSITSDLFWFSSHISTAFFWLPSTYMNQLLLFSSHKLPRKFARFKNGVILRPLASSKIIVLVAQPILTVGGPPAWAVNKRAELGWPSSRGKGWPAAVCKSDPSLCSFTVPLHFCPFCQCIFLLVFFPMVFCK